MSMTAIDRRPAADGQARAGYAQFAASFAQQRFWVLDGIDPGSAALNIAVRWRLEGELAASAIEAAFATILARHASLRTSLIDADGEPIQLVQPYASLRVASIDLTVLSEAEAWAECETMAAVEARTPFNLAMAPLLRVTHVQICSQVAILLVTCHHTVCDGWSIGILAREVCEICAAHQVGRRPVLAELPISYGAYAARQRAWVEEGGLARDLAFWSKALHKVPYFELPTDFPRRTVQIATGDIQSVLLDRALTDQLATAARRRGCTMFMAVLSGLLLMLHRFSRATDIALGTQVAGRDQEDLENLVGLFINTLLLRVDLSGDPSVAELMARTRNVVLDAFEHRAMPIEKIIEALKPKRFAGHNALFSINFIFQKSFIQGADHGAFRLVDLPSRSAGALYDLNFFMVERPEGWRASCEFNVELFHPKTIDRLLSSFSTILRGIAQDQSGLLSSITVQDSMERQALLRVTEQAELPYPCDVTLPQLIADQATRTPHAAAVVHHDVTLSYRDVRDRSDALAALLVQRGLAPGHRIGVYLTRSTDLVVVPLAILKAGSAYVPLDPIYPPARCAQIIDQSGLSAIVTSSDTQTTLPPVSVPLILVDQVADDAAGTCGQDLSAIDLDSTAYVIFTSGSTGRPKGVQILHRGLANFMAAMRDRPGFSAQDTVVALTTLCFDIAVLELFLPLTVGAKVVIADQNEVRDGGLLLALLKREAVRVMQATPTTWRILLEAGWNGTPSLRMLCGGEPMVQDLARRLLVRSPELWNMYGPTETTIWSSAQRITTADTPITLGQPIANTRFYVVDDAMALAPQGAVGELLIGGAGVAAGYWDMPALTEQRFIVDQFNTRSHPDQPAGRLYRTGDLVRMRHDGMVQFIARMDDQIKIRGFRIELGEIDSVLAQHPGVRHAVAVVREASIGDAVGNDAELHACVELTAGLDIGPAQVVAQIEEQVAALLPVYMRPRRIWVVDTIPLLPNGKIDRTAVRALVTKPDNPAGASTPAAPDSVLAQVREIWCAVLGLDIIDEHADFFDLGGHSLLAARLLAQVASTFGCRISLSALFEAPTLAGFTKLVRSDQRSFDFRQIVRLQPRSTKPGIFAINNTGIYVTLSRRLGEDLPVTALQIFDPSFPQSELPGSIEAIAASYVDLIRRLQPTGPYILLGWCNGGVLAYETARQLHAAGEQVDRVIAVDAWVPGYLNSLGWLRSRLVDFSYRFSLIRTDWQRYRRGERSLAQFILHRRMVVALTGGRKIAEPARNADPHAAETYDRWLLTYLDRLLLAYRPQPFPCRMLVVRSAEEPSGPFLDPKLGWTDYATLSVDLTTVPGGHYSAFQEPGISKMADFIRRSLGLS